MNNFLSVGAIAVIVVALIGATNVMTVLSSPEFLPPASKPGKTQLATELRAAPTAIAGDNVYVAWWINQTGNDEVMFRASNDGAATFSDKINFSNSTDAESQDVEIAADGDYVIITWWERNQTAEEPVTRISTDNGMTFGPLLKLATNGTIGEIE